MASEHTQRPAATGQEAVSQVKDRLANMSLSSKAPQAQPLADHSFEALGPAIAQQGAKPTKPAQTQPIPKIQNRLPSQGHHQQNGHGQLQSFSKGQAPSGEMLNNRWQQDQSTQQTPTSQGHQTHGSSHNSTYGGGPGNNPNYHQHPEGAPMNNDQGYGGPGGPGMSHGQSGRSHHPNSGPGPGPGRPGHPHGPSHGNNSHNHGPPRGHRGGHTPHGGSQRGHPPMRGNGRGFGRQNGGQPPYHGNGPGGGPVYRQNPYRGHQGPGHDQYNGPGPGPGQNFHGPRGARHGGRGNHRGGAHTSGPMRGRGHHMRSHRGRPRGGGYGRGNMQPPRPYHAFDGVRPDGTSDRNLYVAKMPCEWDEQKLREAFRDFGKIEHVKVLTNLHGNSRGVGFVHFHDPGAAQNAVREMNGKAIPNGEPLVCRFAKTRPGQPSGPPRQGNYYPGGPQRSNHGGYPPQGFPAQPPHYQNAYSPHAGYYQPPYSAYPNQSYQQPPAQWNTSAHSYTHNGWIWDPQKNQWVPQHQYAPAAPTPSSYDMAYQYPATTYYDQNTGQYMASPATTYAPQHYAQPTMSVTPVSGPTSVSSPSLGAYQQQGVTYTPGWGGDPHANAAYQPPYQQVGVPAAQAPGAGVQPHPPTNPVTPGVQVGDVSIAPPTQPAIGITAPQQAPHNALPPPGAENG